MMQVTTKLNLGPINKLKGNLPRELAKAVAATAFTIQRDAQRRAPVDTGTLKNSIYTVLHGSSGREEALANAEAAWPGPGKKGTTHNPEKEPMPILPSPAAPVPITTEPALGAFHAVVAVGVEYGQYVNYGTGRMAAKPFMTEAANANRNTLSKAVDAALKRAVRP